MLLNVRVKFINVLDHGLGVSEDIRDLGGFVWKLWYAECGVPQGPMANVPTS